MLLLIAWLAPPA